MECGMLKNIALGTYITGETLLHRLQARTKILLLVWCIGWSFVASSFRWHFAPYVALVCCALSALVLSGISPLVLWKRVRILLLLLLLGIPPVFFEASDNPKYRVLFPVGPVVMNYGTARLLLWIGTGVAFLLLAILHTVLRGKRGLGLIKFLLGLALVVQAIVLWLIGGEQASAALTLGPLRVTDYAVWLVVIFFVMLLIFYSFSMILTTTTAPIALVEGMSMLMTPLRKLRLPVDDFTLMAMLALRFVPTLLEEVETLLKAQTSRGADFSTGSLLERLQSLRTLFVPLVQGTFRRASELATALEARGYEVEGRQTRLYETSLSRIDYLTLGIVVLVSIGSFFIPF
jgi:energy-coupling factor transport system permease protein